MPFAQKELEDASEQFLLTVPLPQIEFHRAKIKISEIGNSVGNQTILGFR